MSEHPFRQLKQQIGFETTWLRGMWTNCCKVKVQAALMNFSLAQRQ